MNSEQIYNALWNINFNTNEKNQDKNATTFHMFITRVRVMWSWIDKYIQYYVQSMHTILLWKRHNNNMRSQSSVRTIYHFITYMFDKWEYGTNQEFYIDFDLKYFREAVENCLCFTYLHCILYSLSFLNGCILIQFVICM